MSQNHILRCTNYPTVSVPVGGLFGYLHGEAVGFDSRLALVETKSGKRLTYSEVFSLVERVAYHLYRHGVRKGDVFALCAANSVNYVILILALARLGAVFQVINALSSTDDLKNALSLSGAKYLFIKEGRSDDVRRVMSKTSVKAMFVEDSSASTFFEPIPSGETPPPIERVSSNDVCMILSSSGTSGLPKAVALTNRNFLCTCLVCAAVGVSAPEDKPCVIFQPLSHIVGVCLVFMSMASGAHSVIVSQYDFKLYLELVAKYKVQQLSLVPPVMVQLVKNPLVAQYDLSSVEEVLVGAAPVSAELEQQVKAKLGSHICIRQLYGMTESTLCTVTPPRAKQTPLAPAGSAGCVAPNTKLKFIDTTSKVAVGPNRRGEIWVKSDQVMKGYVGNQQATREAIDEDGWLRTGDVGFYDENGYVFIVDRLKELIKYNAYQVAPAELEGLLLNHPAVADAGVIGLPDESHGELPHAWIVRKPGSTVTEQDIIDFVAGKVASYKKLRGGVKFVPEIPKSPSGKILRRIMRSKMTTPDGSL